VDLRDRAGGRCSIGNNKNLLALDWFGVRR
jgi:hypothetical protein